MKRFQTLLSISTRAATARRNGAVRVLPPPRRDRREGWPDLLRRVPRAGAEQSDAVFRARGDVRDVDGGQCGKPRY